MALSYTQSPTTYLSGSGVIIGATTVSVTSFVDIYGNVLTMASFGAKGYATLEPDTSNEEAFTFTAIAANANGTYSLSGVSSALAQTPYTETSGLIRQHAGGTKMVITDNVAFWNNFANKANNETVTGTWTFNIAPAALSSTPASTSILGNVKLTSTPFTTLGVATISIASPAVVSFTAHGLINADSVQFTTTGVLPTGLSTATNYFVIAAGLTANSFEVSLTVGGTAIVTSGTQSGVQTLVRTTPFAVGNDDARLPTTSQIQFLTATPGMITMYGGLTAPTGFLLCDGTAVSRTTNAALFTAIGTNWGTGDGSTTFNVPDLRSRTPLGKGVGIKVATFASRVANVITVTGLTNANNNEFQTGQLVTYFTTGTAMGGLTNNSTYWVVRVSNNSFSLTTQLSQAQNGSPLVTLTSDGTGTQTWTLALTTRTVGDTGGEETHAMSLIEFLAHVHQAGGYINNSGGAVQSYTSTSTNVANTTSVGGNAAMNIMAPFAVVNYVIKT